MSVSLIRLFLLCGLFFPLLLAAQPPANYGTTTPRQAEKAAIGLSDAAAIDQLMFYIPGIGSPSREAMERQSVQPYLMPVRQLADTRLDWAYALTSSLEYYANLNRNFKDNLSPDYLSLSLRASGRQVSLEDGLRFLAETGTVSASIMPYGSVTIPPAVYATQSYRITNYLHIFRDVTRPRERVFEVKKALSRGNPVIVQMSTGADFDALRTSLYQPVGTTDRTSSLVVVGYDQNAETFQLRANKGRDWAEGGYVNVGFEDFGRLARDGYVLVPLQQY
ncbi:MAG: C1 family peptidase [Saprospiraceae bacterium]